ncbi:MAG: hypothetical protein IIB74_09890 [Proteobacteria bacterium]|nr:hypothetical protein [Pseudomonadota bacterium]MCH8100734.1 hypothetical protein [Pseudomonadota bacterium]
MRELTMSEIGFVSGAGDDCPSGEDSSGFAGLGDTSQIGKNLVNIYEGLVAATSHIIERVANAL